MTSCKHPCSVVAFLNVYCSEEKLRAQSPESLKSLLSEINSDESVLVRGVENAVEPDQKIWYQEALDFLRERRSSVVSKISAG